MTDSFDVSAQSVDVLEQSHVVEELRVLTKLQDVIPVLIDDVVAYFHEIEGGYAKESDVHIVNLVHTTQGDRSPTDITECNTVEIHTDEQFVSLDVVDYVVLGTYPETDYTLSVSVGRYETGEYSFPEELLQDIDKRERRHTYDE